MGCQGDIYAVYGVVVEAKVDREEGEDINPVMYSINGHTVCDEDMNEDYADAEFRNGVDGPGYGAADLTKPLGLTTRILGHSAEHTYMKMGSRHFDGDALVGYAVCDECYINGAAELPPMDDIAALGPKLVKEIKEKLGLEISLEQLRLHLLFDSLN